MDNFKGMRKKMIEGLDSFARVFYISKRIEELNYTDVDDTTAEVYVLPDSLKIIGTGAFSDCKNLKKIVFVDEQGNITTNKVEKVLLGAFENVPLEEWPYSSELKHVGSYAFAGTNLTHFAAPYTLEYVCFDAFYETSLKSFLAKDCDGNTIYFKNKELSIEKICPLSVEEISLPALDRHYCFHHFDDLKRVHCMSSCRFTFDSENKLKLILHKNLDCRYWEPLSSRVDFGTNWFDLENMDMVFAKDLGSFISVAFLKCGCLVVEEGIKCLTSSAFLQTNSLILPSTICDISYLVRPPEFEKIFIPSSVDLLIYKDIITKFCGKSVTIYDFEGGIRDKLKYRVITPTHLSIEFVKKMNVQNEETLESNGKSEVLPSKKQSEYDEITNELIHLISLFPVKYQSDLKEQYNLIVNRYHESMKKMPNLSSSIQLTLAPSLDVVSELRKFHDEILFNYSDIQIIRDLMVCKEELKRDSFDEVSNPSTPLDMIRHILAIANRNGSYYVPNIRAQILKWLDSTIFNYTSRMEKCLENSTYLENCSDYLGSLKHSLLDLVDFVSSDDFIYFSEMRKAYCFSPNSSSFSSSLNLCKETLNLIDDEQELQQFRDMIANSKILIDDYIHSSIVKIKPDIEKEELLEQIRNLLSDFIQHHLLNVITLKLMISEKIQEVKNSYSYYQQKIVDVKTEEMKDKNSVALAIMKENLIPEVMKLPQYRKQEFSQLIKDKVSLLLEDLPHCVSECALEGMMKEYYDWLFSIYFSALEWNRYADEQIMTKFLK